VFFTHRRQVAFSVLTNVAQPCILTSTLTMKRMSCFCCLWRKVNLPLRSVERFVATETFHTGQEHLFFSPVNSLVSCFSWAPCRKTIDMAINNCGELLMFHCFGLRYNRHEKSWNKHQKRSCDQIGTQPKRWTKHQIWCLVARRFTLFGHDNLFARPKMKRPKQDCATWKTTI